MHRSKYLLDSSQIYHWKITKKPFLLFVFSLNNKVFYPVVIHCRLKVQYERSIVKIISSTTSKWDEKYIKEQLCLLCCSLKLVNFLSFIIKFNCLIEFYTDIYQSKTFYTSCLYNKYKNIINLPNFYYNVPFVIPNQKRVP